MPEEPGLLTPLVSMGGISSSYGRGRFTEDLSRALSTTSLTVVPANARRISCFLQNPDAAIDMWVQVGADAAANTGFYLPYGGGWKLFNHEEPWIGDIRAIAASGTPTIIIVEVSVQ